MKYVAGLSEYIRKELKLFTVESIHEATIKAIAIEGKLKKNDTKVDGKQSGGKPNGSGAKKEDAKTKGKGEPNGKGGLVCNHCKANGHVEDTYWDTNPHLMPKG